MWFDQSYGEIRCEQMSIWFFINLAVFIIALWKISSGQITSYIVLGGFRLVFIRHDCTRHAVLSAVRADISRKRKIKYAILSKKAFPIHKYAGSAALLFVIVHASLIMHYFGLQLTNMK